jgi:hypothetical protein
MPCVVCASSLSVERVCVSSECVNSSAAASVNVGLYGGAGFYYVVYDSGMHWRLCAGWNVLFSPILVEVTVIEFCGNHSAVCTGQQLACSGACVQAYAHTLEQYGPFQKSLEFRVRVVP